MNPPMQTARNSLHFGRLCTCKVRTFVKFISHPLPSLSAFQALITVRFVHKMRYSVIVTYTCPLKPLGCGLPIQPNRLFVRIQAGRGPTQRVVTLMAGDYICGGDASGGRS